MSTKKSGGADMPARTKSSMPNTTRGLSLIAASIAVLEAAAEPMNTKAIVAAAKERGFWTPGKGRTPEQTLYSAFAREIKTKGSASRFKLADRGRFELNRR